MAAELDVDAMLQRFRDRAHAVRQRGVPPLEGVDRKRFVDQARTDYMDYAMIGDARALLEGGILTLTVDLRPASARQVGREAGEQGAGSHEAGGQGAGNR